MSKLPEVVGLTLCQRMDIDRATGEVSLVGLFQSLRFRHWPTPPQRFTVYAALHDGMGEGTIKLTINHLETERDIYVYQRWLTFPGRMVWASLVIPVTLCVFPRPGRYAVTLLFDGQQLTQRFLDLYSD